MPPSQLHAGPPASKPQTESQLMWRSITQIEANIQQIVNEVNAWIQKIQGIDSVAFAALLMHEGKEFKLDEEGVARNQAQIKDVLDTMAQYREKLRKEAEAQQEETAKAQRAEAAKGIGGLPTSKEKAPKKVKAKDDRTATPTKR